MLVRLRQRRDHCRAPLWELRAAHERTEQVVYAIVRSGGKQHKVAVGDVLTVEKLAGEAGASVSLPVVLLVDGDAVTTEAAALAQASVTAEVVGPAKGPKIRMIHYKNKSGYKRRQGHRQHLTTLRITGISASPNTSGA